MSELFPSRKAKHSETLAAEAGHKQNMRGVRKSILCIEQAFYLPLVANKDANEQFYPDLSISEVPQHSTA